MNKFFGKSRKSGYTPTPTFFSYFAKNLWSILISKPTILLKESENVKGNTFLQKESGCRGFTLVEMLVVLSIFGVLGSFVTASIDDAGKKARDVNIKASLSHIRTVAEEVYYDQTPNSYLPVCLDSPVDLILNKIKTQNGDLVPDYQCLSSADTWIAVFPLSTGEFWCTDSLGTSLKVDGFIDEASESALKCALAVNSEGEAEVDPPEGGGGGFNSAPVLTLLGDNPYEFWHPSNNPFSGNSPNKYVEPGYTAIDAQDGDITGNAVIQGPNLISQDTKAKWNGKKCPLRTYELLYSITDSGGLSDGPAPRTVIHHKCNE